MPVCRLIKVDRTLGNYVGTQLATMGATQKQQVPGDPETTAPRLGSYAPPNQKQHKCCHGLETVAIIDSETTAQRLGIYEPQTRRLRSSGSEATRGWETTTVTQKLWT